MRCARPLGWIALSVLCTGLAVLAARRVRLQSRLEAATRTLAELADTTRIAPELAAEHAEIYRALAQLDGQLEWWAPDELAFAAPWMWIPKHRPELECGLQALAPLLVRMADLLESPECRRLLAEARAPAREIHRLGRTRNWQNLLCARAIAGHDTMDRARWLLLAFEHVQLRDDGSGWPLDICLAAITLHATQAIATDATTDAALLRCELDERLRLGALPHDFKYQAAIDARYVLERGSLRPDSVAHLQLWNWVRPAGEAAHILEAASIYGEVSETGRVSSSLADSSTETGFMYFMVRPREESRRRHELARIGLALAEFRQSIGRDPASLAELVECCTSMLPRDPLTGRLATVSRDGTETCLSFPDGGKSPVDVWRFVYGSGRRKLR